LERPRGPGDASRGASVWSHRSAPAGGRGLGCDRLRLLLARTGGVALVIGLLALLFVLLAATAGGLALLDGLGATPRGAGDRLLAGCAAGLGLVGVAGLALAEAHLLRAGPIVVLGVAAIAIGGAPLATTLRALRWPQRRGSWAVMAGRLPPLAAGLSATGGPKQPPPDSRR